MATQEEALNKACRSACFDELSKIAQQTSEDRKKWIKRQAKIVGLLAAGTGAGYLAGGAGEYALSKAFGSSWQKLDKPTRMKVIGAALGLAGSGLALSKDYMNKKREEELKNG